MNDFDEISLYAQDDVSLLIANNIINGRENGNFYPSDNATRAEAFKILSAYLSV